MKMGRGGDGVTTSKAASPNLPATQSSHRNIVVLGIDPGLATTGWGVVEKDSPPLLKGFGVIVTPANTPLPDRLLRIRCELNQLFYKYQPDVMVIEELFFAKFAKSIAATAQARGAILCAAAEAGIPVIEYNPRAVKMASTGFGSASKIQIQSMVKAAFNMKELPRPDDAADALAMALCHLQTNMFLKTSKKITPELAKALAAVEGNQ
jgi:crossover junction endodeoxyribonuclease RuvC